MTDNWAEDRREGNWGAEPWREPKTDEGDTVLYSEHGRILGKVDYRSHWLMMVHAPFDTLTLLVKHGGGQERINLGYKDRYWEQMAKALEPMDSNSRYLMLYALYDLYTDTRRRASEMARAELKLAFVEGRLKKRKIKGQAAYKVKVEPRQEARR